MNWKTLFPLAMLAACGNSSTDGEFVGQVKKVTKVTPLICPSYYAVDISLGVMRNGTGSMSTQDMWLTVENIADVAALKKMADAGSLVKVTYNTRRMAICTEEHIMTAATVTE